MDKVTVATAQQQMRLFDSLDGYRRELIRFMSMARAKGAQLVVFPPLAGVMASSHEIEGFRVGLLKQASEGQHKARSLWSRTRTAVAEGTAALLGANYRRTYISVLESHIELLAERHHSLFGELARTYEMTIVAGSAYVRDAGIARNRVIVFGPDGAELGFHDKLILSREDEGIAEAGEAGWKPVDTPVGRLGILFEQEALYPEAGRVLAYAGADIIISLAAVGSESLAAYIRHATLSHAQANRCFALSAFLVGRNYLAAEEGSTAGFMGRSGIYAPLDMTPRYSGVLVEMGTSEAEGLLTAEFDRAQLHYLWEQGSEPVRKLMPVGVFAGTLPALYAAGRTLDDAWRLEQLPEPSPLAAGLPSEEGQPAEIEGEAWAEPGSEGEPVEGVEPFEAEAVEEFEPFEAERIEEDEPAGEPWDAPLNPALPSGEDSIAPPEDPGALEDVLTDDAGGAGTVIDTDGDDG